MKVIFTLETFFPHSKAGTEIYALNLARALKVKGHTIFFVVPYKEKTFVDDYSYEGFSVFTFPVSDSVNPKEANGLIPPKGLTEFIRIIKAINPVIVHFHSFGRAINYYHLLAVRDLHIKTVFTPHLGGIFCVRGDFKYLGKTTCSGQVDSKKCFTCFAHSRTNNTLAAHLLSTVYTPVQHTPIHKLFPPAWQVVEHRRKELEALKAADAIISLSPWIEETLKLNEIVENVHLVSQGIQSTFDVATIAEKFVSKPVVGYVGRIYPIKGIGILLEAFKRIEGKADLKVLTMAPTSDVEYYATLKKQFIEMSNVTWLEDLAHDELVEEYKQIDVLCIPSLNEMAPLVIQEAAALKIPVLGSSIPAITDVITHDINGLIFESGDAEDLLNQLERIINEPELLPMLTKSLMPARTFRDIGNEMDRIYRAIMNNSKPA